MKPLRIGVIGCGRVAREVHLRVLTSLPQAQIVALADADAPSLKSAQKLATNAKTYCDANALFDDAQVQAVVIATPNASHALLATEAFRRGLHVYLEKPMALELAEAQNVVAAWRTAQQSAQIVGAIGFNYRFNPLLQNAARLMQQGAIGKIVAFRSSFCALMHNAPSHNAPSWKTARQSGGGVLLDLASHHIDTLQTLTSQKVVSAWAQIRSIKSEDDTAATELRLENGVLVQGFFSQNAVERDLWEIEGESGRMRIDRYNHTQVEITRAGELGIGAQMRRLARACGTSSTRSRINYLRQKQREPNHEPSYRVAWQSFIAAAQNATAQNATAQNVAQHGTTEEVAFATPLDGLRNLQIVLALEEAARSGVSVTL